MTNLMDKYRCVLDLVVFHHNIDNRRVEQDHWFQHIQHFYKLHLHRNILHIKE